MASTYSTKAFFRNAPNALLERYCNQQQLLSDFDFKSLKETKIDALFDAWVALDDNIRQPHEAIFQDIFNLSGEKGTKAILDEAAFHDPDGLKGLPEILANKSNHFDRAFCVFLDFPEYWKGAAQFFHADSLSQWRKRNNMPQTKVNCEQSALDRLAELIGSYFHHKEGRGKHCFVDPLRRNHLDYFFAYPEDYSQRSPEWVAGRFAARPHNPAFEIIYVYNEATGTLDLHYKGDRKAVEPLQIFFAEAILGIQELEPIKKTDLVYDLAPLITNDFNFVYAANSGITDVAIKSLRLTSRIQKGDRITLEADYKQDREAVYRLITKLTNSINLSDYYVTRAELVATMVLASDAPPKNITFAVTYPNTCSLKYESEHLILRGMLEASGIEPKETTLNF